LRILRDRGRPYDWAVAGVHSAGSIRRVRPEEVLTATA
jgi:hypothetical protein